MDDDAAFADEGFVVGGVVEVTSEAGIIPKEEKVGTFGLITSIADEAVEVVTSDGRASRFGGILIDVTQGDSVPGAVFSDGFELTRYGAILAFATRVTEVGIGDCAREDGGGERGERVGGH
jgi:hypothetical protein